MSLKFYAMLFITVLLFGSCKKDSATEPEVATIINITSPATLAIYLNGSNLTIEGDMSDDNVLSQARVEIRNKSTNAILFQQASSTGNVGFYRFLWNWTITGITTTTMATVKVIAKDKLSNEVSKEVDITLDN
ncbi:MAG TPA: hypothetical protein PKC72_11395 [Chitinophagaceae bacterium]|nr:hypothetical protein [Chitinophagaceae bacterium]